MADDKQAVRAAMEYNADAAENAISRVRYLETKLEAAEKMAEALRRAEVSAWFVATGGHPDAVAIHQEIIAALKAWESTL